MLRCEANIYSHRSTKCPSYPSYFKKLLIRAVKMAAETENFFLVLVMSDTTHRKRNALMFSPLEDQEENRRDSRSPESSTWWSNHVRSNHHTLDRSIQSWSNQRVRWEALGRPRFYFSECLVRQMVSLLEEDARWIDMFFMNKGEILWISSLPSIRSRVLK